jgi:hypothetical protein
MEYRAEWSRLEKGSPELGTASCFDLQEFIASAYSHRENVQAQAESRRNSPGKTQASCNAIG